MDSTVINIDPQIENQPSNQPTIQTYDSPPDSIDRNTSDHQVHNEPIPSRNTNWDSVEQYPTTSKNDTYHAILIHLWISLLPTKSSANALQPATANGTSLKQNVSTYYCNITWVVCLPIHLASITDTSNSWYITIIHPILIFFTLSIQNYMQWYIRKCICHIFSMNLQRSPAPKCPHLK